MYFVIESGAEPNPPLHISERGCYFMVTPYQLSLTLCNHKNTEHAVWRWRQSYKSVSIRETCWDCEDFSRRFGPFITSRLLRVAKKHKAWFLFAGTPVRFSLREFTIVTGLTCRKFLLWCSLFFHAKYCIIINWSLTKVVPLSHHTFAPS